MPLDIVRCPVCGKSVAWGQTPTRPFCSIECKQRDLGNWAAESYRIPEVDGSSDGETEDKPDSGNTAEDESTPPRRR